MPVMAFYRRVEMLLSFAGIFLQTRPVALARGLAILWIALSLSETIVTYFCLQHAGNIEGNPAARALLMRDEALFYGVKTLVTFGVGTGFWLLATRTRHVRALVICEVLLVVIFSIVLVNNLIHL